MQRSSASPPLFSQSSIPQFEAGFFFVIVFTTSYTPRLNVYIIIRYISVSGFSSARETLAIWLGHGRCMFVCCIRF